ncbi:hypothetical protein FOA52_003013 [Chlamydomonas sp. UWO 241]|nr:hypothetical protein FOA52_003013 [Chlamydomonas sp. UWO 241]
MADQTIGLRAETPNSTAEDVAVTSRGCCGGCCGEKKEEETKEEAGPESKKPKYRKSTQQEMSACKPVYTRAIVAILFLSVTIIAIPLGIVFVVYGLQPEEVSFRYDEVCLNGLADNAARQEYIQANAGDDTALACTVSITIDVEMKPPIYIYYEIAGMFQSHRRYVRSHLDLQLADAGGWESLVAVETAAQSCVPLIYLEGNKSQLINPCGLVAWSFFNDSYDLTRVAAINGATETLAVSEDGVAFTADVKRRFADYYPQFFNPAISPGEPGRGGATINGTVKSDQRFMVWMRLSQTSNFRKLWGIIENQELKPGDVVNVTVLNQYNTYSFNGKKSIVLATTSWLGGRSIVLGCAYIIAGGMALVFALVYLLITVVWPRPFADCSRLLKHPPAVAKPGV